MRMTASKYLLAAAIAAFAATASAQAPRPARGPQPPAAKSAADAEKDALAGYVIGPDDVIEVSVLGQPEFTTRARVRTNGTIALPFIGEVPVGGQTAITLGQAVSGKLKAGGYYANPIVNVDIVGFASRYVIILGDIAQPGLQPVDRAYRLSEVIARAGGLRESGADYVLVRRANGQEIKVAFETLASGGLEQDPLVEPGDKIYVPSAELFYIYGQVGAPGQYPLKGNAPMTVRMALARAGGIGPNGSQKRIKVFRNGAETKIKMDEPIRPNDVLVVGERLF
jgi:polysaccharide biosynthesis/export protein